MPVKSKSGAARGPVLPRGTTWDDPSNRPILHATDLMIDRSGPWRSSSRLCQARSRDLPAANTDTLCYYMLLERLHVDSWEVRGRAC